MNLSETMTTTEASKILKISKRGVISAIERGRISADQFGSVWALSRQSVLDYKENREPKGPNGKPELLSPKERRKRRTQQQLDYAKRHPDKVRAQRRRYKARKRGAKGDVTADEWNRLLRFYDGKCLSCEATENITQDHIRPISKGGTHTIENIQPLCKSCNASKNATFKDYRETIPKWVLEKAKGRALTAKARTRPNQTTPDKE